MAKNIVIFSDGTGQAGGIRFDEDRTNVYKLYRATRCGPDSVIDPTKQVAFYDPGLGSSADGGRGLIWDKLWGKLGQFFLQPRQSGHGLGDHRKHHRLLRGVDQALPAGRPHLSVRIQSRGVHRALPRSGHRKMRHTQVASGRTALASRHRRLPTNCDGRGEERLSVLFVEAAQGTGTYRDFMLDTREAIARRFRADHQSADPSDAAKANTYPYFIGVFDTVAALSRPGSALVISSAAMHGDILSGRSICVVRPR